MRILIDECVPHAVADFLKSKGLAVSLVTQIDSGAKNGAVYKIAIKDFSILITTDRHFKNTLKFPATSTTGIIYVRVQPLITSEIIIAISHFLSKDSIDNVVGKTLILHRNSYFFIAGK